MFSLSPRERERAREREGTFGDVVAQGVQEVDGRVHLSSLQDGLLLQTPGLREVEEVSQLFRLGERQTCDTHTQATHIYTHTLIYIHSLHTVTIHTHIHVLIYTVYTHTCTYTHFTVYTHKCCLVHFQAVTCCFLTLQGPPTCLEPTAHKQSGCVT